MSCLCFVLLQSLQRYGKLSLLWIGQQMSPVQRVCDTWILPAQPVSKCLPPPALQREQQNGSVYRNSLVSRNLVSVCQPSTRSISIRRRKMFVRSSRLCTWNNNTTTAGREEIRPTARRKTYRRINTRRETRRRRPGRKYIARATNPADE